MAVSQAGEVLGSCCSSYFQLESCCKFIFVKVALYKKSGTSVLNFVFVTCLSLPTWSILLVKLLFRCTLLCYCSVYVCVQEFVSLVVTQGLSGVGIPPQVVASQGLWVE